MTSLTLVSTSPQSRPASTQIAHDIRNAVATAALHLETLERLAGPRGSKAASAAQALIGKAVSLCSQALNEQHAADLAKRRGGFDLARTAHEVERLLAPLLPPTAAFNIRGEPAAMALGDPIDVFRILFNLAHNAVMVARDNGALSRIDVSIERRETLIAATVSDNGPGLPKAVARNVFRKTVSERGCSHGCGLAIARELAERNGGTLTVATGPAGTTFTLLLAPFARLSLEGPATRMLGRRAMNY